jgi:hypothetical protein
LNLKYILTVLLLLTAAGVNAQSRSIRLFDIKEADNNNSAVLEQVNDYVALDLKADAFNKIFTEKQNTLKVEIPLSGGNKADVVLKRFDILTSDAKLIVKEGEAETEADIKNILTAYTGTIEGMENSFVTLNFSVNGVSGIVVTSSDRYVLGKSEALNGYILYQNSKTKVHSDFVCGSEDMPVPPHIQQMMNNIGAHGHEHRGGNALLSANVALDIDYTTFIRFGSIQNATAYALGLMTSVSALYVREMNVKLTVSYSRVWTTNDPYTGTTSNSILNQFRSQWNSTQQGVNRTIAHLISTRAGGLGGIAWVGVLCDGFVNGFGYGFSNTNGGYNVLPTYSWDVDVVAHEIGHNFGSPHTHSCTWPGGPIDSCYAVEGNCYNGPAISRVGTIMSYCHLNGSKTLDFGPLPRELIRQNAENAGCLGTISSGAFWAYPNGGEVFKTFNTVKLIWGAGFSGNVNVEYSTNNGGTWQTIQNNLPSTQDEYDWTIPNLDTTLQARIRVYNASNPSQGDTCDAPFTIQKNLTMQGMVLVSPPSFSRVVTGASDTSRLTFTWRKAGFHPSIRYKWGIKKIGGSTEYIYTSQNSGIDTSISVRKNFLDSLARANFGLTNDTVACTWRSWAYNGYDSIASNIFIITLADQSVGINPISQVIPSEFKLNNNYPNPFNPETKIEFALPKESFVRITVYDFLGREVNRLVNEKIAAGSYSVNFTAGSSLASGVYFYRIEADYGTGSFTAVKRMVLVK